MSKKIIDMDNTLMYSELWYLRNYTDNYSQQVKVYPASGNTNIREEILPWDIPKNTMAQIEVHDTQRNRWYELQEYQQIQVGTSHYFGIAPIVKGTKAGIAVNRVNYSGQSRPGITLTMRLRTMTPPFIQ